MRAIAVVSIACLGLSACAEPGAGVATRGRPVAGYAQNGVVGLLWHDARVGNALPLCDSEAVIGEISRKFSQKEGQFWNSPLSIVNADTVRELRLNGYTIDNLPRRGCLARVLTSDGVYRDMSYTITAANGILGYGWGVTWCVSGVDRGWAHNPACRRAEP